MRTRTGLACLLFHILLIGCAVPAIAADAVTVGVAANFARPLSEINHNYEEETGIPVLVAIASSGTLFAQLINGAPFDVFLSADRERPARLHEDGICLQPFAYARGRTVLWSRKEAVMQEATWLAAVKSGQTARIALPNPELAPYGMVLEPILREAFSRPEFKDKLIYGQNVAQAFQFAATGAVDASFTSLSFALSEEGRTGRFWELPASADVNQWGCIRMATPHRVAAEKFVQVLQSARVKELLKAYGYH